MSTTEKNDPPLTASEWVGVTEERLAEHDNPKALRCGDWTLYTDPDTGDLVAGHVEGGIKRLAARPSKDQGADQVVDAVAAQEPWSPYYLIVERKQDHIAPVNYSFFPFTSLRQSSGNWGSGAQVDTMSIGQSQFQVPADGIYSIAFETHGAESDYWIGVQVNGPLTPNIAHASTLSIVGSSSTASDFDRTLVVPAIFLAQGDLIRAIVDAPDSLTFRGSPAGSGAHSRLTIIQVAPAPIIQLPDTTT